MHEIGNSMDGAGWIVAGALGLANAADFAIRSRRRQLARRERERARRLESAFAAHTSHELRTPLNAVIGFATLIEQDAVSGPEESRELAAQIRRSAEHLLGLLNGILDRARESPGGPAGIAAPGPAGRAPGATGDDEPAWERREARR